MSGSARAFTVIELLAVVVIVGAIAAALATAAGATSDEQRRERAVASLRDFLAVVRVEAMQRSEDREAVVWVGEGRLRATDGVRERAWRAPGVLIDPAGLSEDDERRLLETGRLAAVFDATGRTRQRRWTFDARAAGGTIHVLTFDPVSSVPAVEPGD